jgi:hypothetical protein
MGTLDALDAFRSFRTSFYECLGRRADALFDLADASSPQTPFLPPFT